MKRVKMGSGQGNPRDRERIDKAAKNGGQDRISSRWRSKATFVAQYSTNKTARAHAITILSEISDGKRREDALSTIAFSSCFEGAREKAAKLILDTPLVKTEMGLLVVALECSGDAAMKAVGELAYSDSVYSHYYNEPAFDAVLEGGMASKEEMILINIAENLIEIMKRAVDENVSSYAAIILAGSRFTPVRLEIEHLLMELGFKEDSNEEDLSAALDSDKKLLSRFESGSDDWFRKELTTDEHDVMDDLKGSSPS